MPQNTITYKTKFGEKTKSKQTPNLKANQAKTRTSRLKVVRLEKYA